MKLSDIVINAEIAQAVELMAADMFVFEEIATDLDHALAYAAQLKQERDSLARRVEALERSMVGPARREEV